MIRLARVQILRCEGPVHFVSIANSSLGTCALTMSSSLVWNVRDPEAKLKLWDPEAGFVKISFNLDANLGDFFRMSYRTSCVAVSADGGTAVTGSWDMTARV